MENLDKKNKLVPMVALVLVVLALGGYLIFGKNKINNPVNNNATDVATVNGVIIPKATYDTELTKSIASYKAQGIDVTDATKLSQIKKQVLSDLIDNELLAQNISAAGIKTTPEEIETQFQAILTQAGGADALKAELIKNNITEAQLRENISKQLVIQTYLLQNIDVKSITVSEAEIAQFYADYSKAQKDSGQGAVPTLETLSAEIKQQIINNKQQTLIMNFVATLRAKAKIKTTL